MNDTAYCRKCGAKPEHMRLGFLREAVAAEQDLDDPSVCFLCNGNENEEMTTMSPFDKPTCSCCGTLVPVTELRQSVVNNCAPCCINCYDKECTAATQTPAAIDILSRMAVDDDDSPDLQKQY